MSDEALAKQHVNDELLQSINIKSDLGVCDNSEAARFMLSYPGIELDTVSTAGTVATVAVSREESAFIAHYIPIVWLSENGKMVKPVLPFCNPSEQLFSDTDKFSRERFDIVLVVANALCVAAGAGWPHLRLSSENIFIHKD